MVTAEIVEELSPEQAQELAVMQNVSDEQSQTWLQASALDFGDIISDEIDILLGELAENSDTFNNSSTDYDSPATNHFLVPGV